MSFCQCTWVLVGRPSQVDIDQWLIVCSSFDRSQGNKMYSCTGLGNMTHLKHEKIWNNQALRNDKYPVHRGQTFQAVFRFISQDFIHNEVET